MTEGLFYNPLAMIPKDGTKIRLILENEGYKWVSTAPYAWNGSKWISAASGIPLPGLINVVGWREYAEPKPVEEKE